VLPALGGRPVREIDTAAVEQAVRAWTAEDVSRSTVRGARAALARVLDEAVADGLLPRNPARDAEDRSAVAVARPEPPRLTSAVASEHSVTDADRSVRDDQGVAGQIEPPDHRSMIDAHGSLPGRVAEPGPAATRRDDPAEASDEELGRRDGTTKSPENGLAADLRSALDVEHDRGADVAGAGESGDGGSLAGARWAVARVGQLRAAAERQAEERARAEQLARWADDDRAAQEHDDSRDLDDRALGGRGPEAAAAASDGGTAAGGRW